MSFSNHPLSLGQLDGNIFSVRVRNFAISGGVVDVAQIVKERERFLSCEGFPNYFGSQRTGKMSKLISREITFQTCLNRGEIPIGPKIGKCLILGQYEEAVRCILCEDYSYDEIDHTNTNEQTAITQAKKKARALYLSNPVAVEVVLTAFPMSCTRERILLTGLIRFGHDNYEASIEELPYKWRLMYVNAYQSYIFNIVMSYRLSMSRTSVLIGDVVKDNNTSKVRTVTEEDFHAKVFQMKDIVLPLFGKNIFTYPTKKQQLSPDLT